MSGDRASEDSSPPASAATREDGYWGTEPGPTAVREGGARWRMGPAFLCRDTRLASPALVHSNPIRCTPLPAATSGPRTAVPTPFLPIPASSPSSDIVIAIKIGA